MRGRGEVGADMSIRLQGSDLVDRAGPGLNARSRSVAERTRDLQEIRAGRQATASRIASQKVLKLREDERSRSIKGPSLCASSTLRSPVLK